MARSIWTGALSFGLVNVPVKLFSAIDEKDVHFHQFQEGTGERIRYQRVAEGSGDEVPYEDIVKGYEVRKGEHVIVTPDELEALEPERSRTIDLTDFVALDEIDPIYYQRTYYLAPAEEGAARPFALLRDAMSDAGRAGVGRFVMRGKEYLAVVRPGDTVLLVETMHFADEVRDPAGIEEAHALDDVGEPPERERRMARRLVGMLATDWDPSRYHDTYRERVLELVEAKARGEEIVTERPEEPAPVADLMSALEASLDEARGRRDGARGEPGDGARAGPGRGSRTGARRGVGGDGGVGEGADRSREELYEEAKRKKVPGRSRMSKDELADALRTAS